MAAERHRVPADVAARPSGDDLLLVHLERGTAFRLNRTARALFERLAAGATAREAAEELGASLAVAVARLEADARALTATLLAADLLELAPAPASSP